MCTYQYELHVYHVVLMVNKINFTLGNSNVFVERIECHNINKNWNSNFLPNVVSVIHILYKENKNVLPFYWIYHRLVMYIFVTSPHHSIVVLNI